MRLFISWSGDVSHQVALHLRELLPVLLPVLRPWVSSEDIPKGTRWGEELSGELESTDAGIVCLVPGNAGEAWLNFEAGALSKVVDKARVHPFMLGINPTQLSGPLQQFQATRFDKNDVRKLVISLNAQAGEAGDQPIPAEQLERAFEALWPELERRLTPLLTAQEHREPIEQQPAEDSSRSPVLTGDDVKMLLAIASASDGLRADDAGAMFGIHPQRAQHTMERLEEMTLLDAALNYVYGTRWYLSKKGRALLVARKLL